MEVVKPGDLVVEVEGAESLASVYLYLLDVDKRRVLVQDTGGTNNTRSVSRPGLAPGTYYVRIQHISGYGSYTVEPRSVD